MCAKFINHRMYMSLTVYLYCSLSKPTSTDKERIGICCDVNFASTTYLEARG
jgi:hypothetical protein